MIFTKDIRQSKLHADYLKNSGWNIEYFGGVYYFIKKLPLIGSVIKIQRPKKIDYRKIQYFSNKYRTLKIIIEPDKNTDFASTEKDLIKRGFRLQKKSFLPTKTIVIDLTKSLSTISSDFKKDARYAIRKNPQTFFEKYSMQDIDEFRKIWKKSLHKQKYIPSLKQLIKLITIFRENSLFLCDKDKMAGAVFLIANRRCYYWYAFTSHKGRKHLIQYKLIFEGIKWAKDKSAKVLDFEGIYDERFPNKNWLGFTHFKKSFGGKEVYYPGCFIKNIFPLRYLVHVSESQKTLQEYTR